MKKLICRYQDGQWIKDSVRSKVVPSLLAEELGGLKIPSEEEVTRACKAIKIDTANMLMNEVCKYGVVQKYDFTGGGLIAEMDEDDGDHSSGWASIAVEAVRVLNGQELRHLFG